MAGKVIVFGSINIDLVSSVDRIVRPGETISGSNFATYTGGKGGNQALAAHLAKDPTKCTTGADVVFVGKVGQDEYGQQVLDFFTNHGLAVDNISRSETEPTGIGLIQVEQATGENAIVVIPGANFDLGDTDVDAVLIEPDDVAVSQFEVPMAQNETFFRRARDAGAVTLLNPAPMVSGGEAVLELALVLVVNETELAMLSDQPVSETSSDQDIARAAGAARRHPAQTVVVTLGARGLVALVGPDIIRIQGRDVAPVDTTGAGDCFVGVLAQAMSAGLDIEAALNRANMAASLSVTKAGAASSLPTAAETDAAGQQ